MAADYGFQDECLTIMNENTAGKIILPTGSGKSRIEFRYATQKMKRDDGTHQVVVIVAPRIILCQQLLKDLYMYALKTYKKSVKEVFTFVSSGQVPSIDIDDQEIIKIIKNDNILYKDNNDGTITILGEDIGIHTTKSYDIGKDVSVEKDIRLARENGLDNIVFSTYVSFDECIKGVKAGISEKSEVYLIADEAHYFARRNEKTNDVSPFKVLKNNVNLFKTRFFFTATPKVNEDELEDKGSKMDNEEIYGKDILVKKPKELMNNGIICEPNLDRIKLPETINIDNFDSFAGDFILRAFKHHEKEINKNCGQKHKIIGGKVLVAVDGSKQLYSLIHNGFFKKAQSEGINVAWTMTQEEVGTFVDGRERDIDEF